MPALIPTHTLNWIEEQVVKLMTDTALIEKHQGGSLQYGEESDTWSTIATSQPCRVISIGGRYRTTAGQVGNEQSLRDSYRFIVPAGVVIDIGMRVTVNGIRYDIYALQSAQTNARFSEALISRQRGEVQR